MYAYVGSEVWKGCFWFTKKTGYLMKFEGEKLKVMKQTGDFGRVSERYVAKGFCFSLSNFSVS